MAVEGRLIVSSQERLDLPDLLSIESYVAGDFRSLIKSFVGSRPMVLKGYDVIDAPSSIGTKNISIRIADSVVYNPLAAAGSFHYGLPEGDPLSQPLTPDLRLNATNYVYLTISTEGIAKDARAFWDVDANGGQGGEFSQEVNTEAILIIQVGVSVSTFPDGTIPIAKVVMDTSVITSITDCRNMMFRLGSGGINPNSKSTYAFRPLPSIAYARDEPFVTVSSSSGVNPFFGGDKNFFNMKEWMDVVMTKLLELSGTTYWYEITPDLSLASLFDDTMGSSIKSKGQWHHDSSVPGKVTWSEDIIYRKMNDLRDIIVRANPSTGVTLANEQVLWMHMVRDKPINTTNTPVNWVSSVNYVNGSAGSFTNLKQGDWIKRDHDDITLYLRVEQLWDGVNGTGSPTTGSLALSITLSANYAGPTITDIGVYAKGEFLNSDLIISNRNDAVSFAAGGDFYWLANRSDTIENISSIASTFFSANVNITDSDGQRAKLNFPTPHGLVNGDSIVISGGSAPFNGVTYQIEVESSLIAVIQTTDTTNPTGVTASWSIVTTAARSTTDGYQLENADHGFANGQTAIIAGTGSGYDTYTFGSPSGSVGEYLVSVRSATTFQIPYNVNTSVGAVGTATCAKVILRTEFGAIEVVQGETININEPDTANILSFIGMDSLAEITPVYSLPSGYNALSGFQNYNSLANDNLTARVSKLTAMMADRVQDRGLKILNRLVFRNVGDAVTVSGGDLLVEKPGSAQQTISISGGFSLTTNQALVAVIDRNGSATITPTTESLGSPFLVAENKLILFYRFAGTSIYAWDGSEIKNSSSWTSSDPETSQNKNVFVQDRAGASYGSITLTGTAAATGTSLLTGTGTTFLSQLINGQTITFNGVIYTIASITTNTSLTVTTTIPTASGLPITGNQYFNYNTTAVNVDIIIPGSVNTNTIDTAALNALSAASRTILDNQVGWIRINRAAAKTINVISNSATFQDSDAAGALYITSIANVPTDQDVFVLYSVRNGVLLLSPIHESPSGNTYEEDKVGTSSPANSNEFAAPLTAPVILTLPNDSRNGGEIQYYVVGSGQLEVFLNGKKLRKGSDIDYTEVGASGTLSNQIQMEMNLVLDDVLTFRIATTGAVYFTPSPSSVTDLQGAYDGGNTITTTSGNPLTISGPAEKLLIVNGDITVTGVIDPKGITFSNESVDPILNTQYGVWVDASGDLMYDKLGVTIPLGEGVTGPGSTVTNGIVRWNSTTGASIENTATAIPLSGIASSTGTNALVGTSTKFNSQLRVGQAFQFNGATYVVATVTNDTHLTVIGTIPTASGLPITGTTTLTDNGFLGQISGLNIVNLVGGHTVDIYSTFGSVFNVTLDNTTSASNAISGTTNGGGTVGSSVGGWGVSGTSTTTAGQGRLSGGVKGTIGEGSVGVAVAAISGDTGFGLALVHLEGLNLVAFRAPSSPGIQDSYSLTLPLAIGATGQVMTQGVPTITTGFPLTDVPSSADLSWAYPMNMLATIGNSPVTGSILFVNGSGQLAQDNTQLFWDDANKQFAIGTNTPTAHATFYVNSTDTGWYAADIEAGSGQSGLLVRTADAADNNQVWAAGGAVIGVFRGNGTLTVGINSVPTNRAFEAHANTSDMVGMFQQNLDVGGGPPIQLLSANPTGAMIVMQRFNNGSGGSGNLSLASAAVTTNYTITFPAAVGSVGQTLVDTDGAGTLAWASPFAGHTTSDLTEGTNLYYTDARVSTLLAANNFVDTWTSGTTFTSTHNLGTTDVAVEVYDIATGETIVPDTVTRTDPNNVAFAATVGPTGPGWRILIQAVL